MGVIIGILIRFMTFPGLVVDTFVLKTFCKMFEIEIISVNYFDILGKNDGVEYNVPQNYAKIIGLTVIPFLSMTAIAMLIYTLAFQIGRGNILILIITWIGLSVATHSFPSTKMGGILWKSSVNEIKKRNLFAIIGFPIVILIYIIKILHIFWFDIIYAIILFLIIYGYFDEGKLFWM